MITAKLIKDLEKKGFKLDFPEYSSNEKRIIDILKTNNERLFLAIPILLQEDFDYKKIITQLRQKNLISQFNKIILITDKIFESENIDNSYINDIIKKNDLKQKSDKKEINKNEIQYYYDAFKDSIKNIENSEMLSLKEQIKFRTKLDINKALSIIFSPAKIRIMEKIFRHEHLTNTELKYYYRAIRPLISAIENIEMHKYLRIVESVKKYKTE